LHLDTFIGLSSCSNTFPYRPITDRYRITQIITYSYRTTCINFPILLTRFQSKHFNKQHPHIRSFGPKGMQGMMLIMQLGVKYTLSKFSLKNYPIQAVSRHIRLWTQTTATLLSMSFVLCFRNSWLRQKKAWPLLLTSFKTRQGRKSFSTSWDHSPTFPSIRANHFVSAESMVLKRTDKKKNGEDSHFG
jgi:hypothetical protein